MEETNGTAPPAPEIPPPDDFKQLKRSWMTLLPHEQIIEIVFKLDDHVAPDIKASIWPTDLKAAIQAISGSSSASAAVKAPAVPVVEKPPPPVQQPQSYPHAPYYAHAPSTAYPAPAHYTPPSADSSPYPYAQYPYAVYPPYPTSNHPPNQPSPYPYPHYTPPPAAPTNITTQRPLFTSAPLTRDGNSAAANNVKVEDGDDLPSYEAMLVEALTELGDADGSAPKAIFTWMAARYPLQANFRPSASQALQKAFRRGRLEKSTDGRYRVNATWEGGNTTRRTTRRPQPHSTPAPAPAPAPAPVPAVTASYPPWVPFGYSVPPQQKSVQPATQPIQPRAEPGPPADADAPPLAGSAASAWEAAQSILQALLAAEAERDAQQLSAAAEEDTLVDTLAACPSSPAPADGGDDAAGEPAGATPAVSSDVAERPRSELQRSLALLAVQLADIVGEASGAAAGSATVDIG